jgi:beta-ribofuranosylaminobenzene 5'-phosphate synthase
MTATFSTGGRLHSTLIDLGRATSEAYGGAGFMISGPEARVEIEEHSRWVLEKDDGIDEKLNYDIQRIFDKLGSITSKRARIVVRNSTPQHIGLGSKTALLLLITNAINEYFRLQLSRKECQLITQRGGTSGIGINGFYDGGFIIDNGHSQIKTNELVPSSFVSEIMEIPKSIHVDVPEDWRFHLLLPDGVRYGGEAELAFFRKAIPIKKNEVLRVCALVYHGLWPAVYRNDLGLLAEVISEISSVGFKKKEIRNQPQRVSRTILHLRQKFRCPVGMSSMGPIIYMISNEPIQKSEAFLRSIENNSLRYMGAYEAYQGFSNARK